MNEKIFRSINHLSGRFALLDCIMIFTSKKVRYVYFLILIFLWIRNKSSKRVAQNALTSVFLVWFIKILTNIFYFKPRPFVYKRVGILIPSKTDSTFLSKHTLLAFAVSSSIFMRMRSLGSFLMGLSILTGFSRIWLGHHYPADILRSALIGGVISYLVDDNLKEVTKVDE